MPIIGWIFPGQGAQSYKMGHSFQERKSFTRIIRLVEDVTGKPVQHYITKTTESELRQTDCAQLSIFAMSSAITFCLREEGITPQFAAGHSLGHFSALAAAGALRLEDAAQLVALRGDLMLRSNQDTPGFMASILGVSANVLENILADNKLQVWVANLNLSNQVVISGCVIDKDEAQSNILKLGGRWVPINVSGAFHSPLLEAESNIFSKKIMETVFTTPHCPIISNINGKPLHSIDTIRDDLTKHMTNQVRWISVMNQFSIMPSEAIIEVGPGKILTDLALRYNRKLRVFSTGTQALLDRVILNLKGNQK